MNNTVTTDPVLLFLRSGGELRVEAARLRHTAAALERRLSATREDDAQLIQLSRLTELRRRCEEKQQEAERQEALVSAFIEALPTAAGRTILRLRYCEGLRWTGGRAGHPCVLSAMHKAGLYYSERQMFRMHNQALRDARQLFEAGGLLAVSA